MSRPAILVLTICALMTCPLRAETEVQIRQFFQEACLDCHSGDEPEAGLDLSALPLELNDPANFDRWVQIHDRIRDGEMPPPDDGIPIAVVPVGWSSSDTTPPGNSPAKHSPVKRFLKELGTALSDADDQRRRHQGRASIRRLNRYEFENAVRQVLDAPWLPIADALPEDGVDHLFNKVADHLDISHVHMARYLSVARATVRTAVDSAAYPSQTRKFYAREEPQIQSYVRYWWAQHSATRAIVPLVDTTPEPDVIRGKRPYTIGNGDPDKREREAMGTFSGTYNATTKYDFNRVKAPIDGRYRLRFKTYTFLAGPHGASGGDDHGLTGGNKKWWRPDRNVAYRGTRSEPITLYALSPSGDSRWLTTFDSFPDPSVFECEVTLRKGENIRPDAARLVRTRPGWKGNPNATAEGVPGFAMNWLEVEGPLQSEWPPPSYAAVFRSQLFEIVDGGVRVTCEDEEVASELIARFYKKTIGHDHRPDVESAEQAQRFVDIYRRARELEEDFTDAVITAVAAILCSPDFLYLKSQPGPLTRQAFHQRLAYFLWNGPPEKTDSSSSAIGHREKHQLVETTLQDARVDRFVKAFLDYWLDLRDIQTNAPDADLYPEYYLDELLTESSVRETRSFFRELIRSNLPVRNLVDADFAFVNERLAELYGFPPLEGVDPRRVDIPKGSVRGGLLTQASVLRVTANGTTTSPVTRGAWVAKRLLGLEVPNPPSGVPAVDPDIRGAKTIREQLDKHRATASCNACHARFDPIGFALESFDVAGGWRWRYRSVGDEGTAVTGLGKNGHAFEFKLAQSIDSTGQLRSGEAFSGIRELKKCLLSDERQLARNLLYQFVVYSTGAAVSFGDRAEVEEMLDRAEKDEFGVRTLIHELVQSKIFGGK